ncbi:MAG: hypothetical protein WC806_00960 [Candidatus Gracilibacteria bacterium]|jgi:hypothetical protein
MKNKHLIGACLVVGLMSLTAASAFAATTNSFENAKLNGGGRGQFEKLTSEERTAKMEEMKALHEKIQQAVVDGDYDTWASLVSEMPMGQEQLKVITKDNFAEFSKAHQLMNEARDILTKLGVEKGPMGGDFGGGPKGGIGRGMGKGCPFNLDGESISEE